jgi:hypothetical protein
VRVDIGTDGRSPPGEIKKREITKMSCPVKPTNLWRWVLIFAASTLTASAIMQPAIASAGNWVEVSCVNPNQSAAGSEGWSSFASGGGYGSNNGTGCSPGSPMFGILSTAAAVGVGSAETIQYSPPGGSALVGGTVDVSMYADGGGYNASGTAVAYSPNYEYSSSSVFFQCANGLTPCHNGTNDYEGTLGLPSNRGGSFYLSAGCGGAPGYACNSGGSHGAWSLIYLWWANFTLSNGSSPAGSGFAGTLLQPNASGTADLGLTATDPGGPGVYAATVQIDGNNLYSATPDNNGGRCIAVGTQGAALMFDYNQPCKQTENVNIPVDTTNLSDGSHTVKVFIVDAAQNVSTVYDGTITTNNAPTIVNPPSVSGVAQVGSTLTGTRGVFEARSGLGPLSSVSGQWLRCSGPGTGCAAIAGAASGTYTLVAADKGYTIEYGNTVEDSHKHKASSASAPTVAVAETPGSGGGCANGSCPGGNGGNGGNGSNGGPGSNSNTTTSTSTTNNLNESISNEALSIARGAANGTPATDQATMSVHWSASASASSVKISYASKTRAQGRLVASSGQPIADATIQVIGTPSSPGFPTYLEGTIKTAGDGTFVFDTQNRRPSRTLTFEYKSHVNDTSLAAQAQLSVGIPVPITLKITPRTISRGRTINMSGSVPGPIPAGGKQIVLQALALGFHSVKWQTFNVVRTNRKGQFKALYRFRFAGPAHYRVRAVSRYEQDYPFLGAFSAGVLVKER